MDKIYEKTRYDNIYRHTKNNNYIIRHNNTTISKINGKKIYDIKFAKDYKSKLDLNLEKNKGNSNSYLFKDLWIEYIKDCKETKKLSYSTLKKKHIIYNRYLKEFNGQKVNAIEKSDINYFINSLSATDKQKNEILKQMKAFINWCIIEKDIISKNPLISIKNIKVPKVEMKYWSIEEFSKFMDFMNTQNSDIAYRIRIFTLIELYLGDRVGETRALTWSSINEEHMTIRIAHSINYDTKSDDFLSSTKNHYSDRIVDVSPKLIEELRKYKEYLISQQINIKDIIFFNYNTNRPYSDVSLRKAFYKYSQLAEVPKIRLYDLRHTYVALMMSEGWKLYHISKRLGHNNYSTTVNKYGHLENKVRKEIAETTDKFL